MLFNRCCLLLTALGIIASLSSEGHLCNDVFAQAQDNLAVKVDIRDGQLRIGEEASFRVYLLNTMDRGIVSINLEVLSDHFEAKVEPSPDWRDFPSLKTSKRGGGKVYFNVMLRRKAGVPDGRYELGLRLFNGRRRSQEFKTVDLAAAAATHRLRHGAVTVDGKATREEWDNSIICTEFHEYVKAGRYYENKPAREQTRARFKVDKEYLYCLLSVQGGDTAARDCIAIYASPTMDQKPARIILDRRQGTVNADLGDGSAVTVKPVRGNAVLECRIPRALLGLEKRSDFYLNLTRMVSNDGRERISYWRGNQLSLSDPVTYDRVIVEN